MSIGQNLSMIQMPNIDFGSQNPYENEVAEQVQFHQMFVQAQRTGTERVNDAFLGFAEEQRETNRVMAEQLKLLGEKLVTQEVEAKLQQDVFLETIKKLGEANSQLQKELAALNNNFKNHTHLPRNVILKPHQTLTVRKFPEEPSRAPIAVPDAVYIREGDYFNPRLKNISDRDVTSPPGEVCIIS